MQLKIQNPLTLLQFWWNLEQTQLALCQYFQESNTLVQAQILYHTPKQSEPMVLDVEEQPD